MLAKQATDSDIFDPCEDASCKYFAFKILRYTIKHLEVVMSYRNLCFYFEVCNFLNTHFRILHKQGKQDLWYHIKLSMNYTDHGLLAFYTVWDENLCTPGMKVL